jgi:hypothetical protein
MRNSILHIRGIFCDGDLPHLATPITHINPSPLSSSNGDGSGDGDGDDSIYYSNANKNSERDTELDMNMNTDKNTDENTDNNKDKNKDTDTDKDTNTDKNTDTDKDKNIDMSMKRVILGFNCFPVAVDECCRRAPEHSGTYDDNVYLNRSQHEGYGQFESNTSISQALIHNFNSNHLP